MGTLQALQDSQRFIVYFVIIIIIIIIIVLFGQ